MTSPAGTGAVDITVITPGGTSATSTADQYTYTAPATTSPTVTTTPTVLPIVTSISPATGPTPGGTVVAIYGSGFSSGGVSDVDEVMFGTTGSASYTFISDSEITAPAPAGAAGTVNIVVITSRGTSAISTADQYTYSATAATVPVPVFSASPVSGIVPLTVEFTDASTGSPTAWSWIFGDGNSSTAEDPTYTYVTDGTYDVTLTETNAAGSNATTRTGYIVIGATAPVADFSVSSTSGTAPLIVQFTDYSTNSPTSWIWDFGDGTTGSDENPSHTYNSAGTYSVSFIAMNTAGSNTTIQSDLITIYEDTAVTTTATPEVTYTDTTQAPVPADTYALPSSVQQTSDTSSSAWLAQENQKMAALNAETPATTSGLSPVISLISLLGVALWVRKRSR